MKNSDHQKDTMGPLETYENKKVFALKGMTISFIAWQFAQIMLNNFAEHLHNTLFIAVHFINFFGALGWAGFIFYLIKISGIFKGNSALKSQVNDERITLIRLRAMSHGFVITLGLSSLFFGASFLFDSFSENIELGGTFVAQAIILVAVSSALISYLILDKEE